MSWIQLVLALLKAFNGVTAMFRAGRERQAGRDQAILEQKRASDDAIDAALSARRAQRAADAAPDRLRENDGFRRD
ncbi:hypothetical protein [Flaviflagellibacter deserti]|uniref:Uncharacterized protein n=1 Tax=Flaviflagellibacter deserti TaxID=2267266 RepID=A0ABV9Z180_9HYPH